MKTKFALLLVFCAISLNIFAQEKKIKDRRTNPELYKSGKTRRAD